MVNKILTIGVPAYNAEGTLKRCLDSFLIPEVMDKIQVIIVNDGSRDKTSEIGHDYEQKYPNTYVVIDKENGGHGSGINATIEHANGKYIKIVDSDDYVEREGLIDLITQLESNDVDLCLSPYYEVLGDNKETKLYYTRERNIKDRTITIEDNDCLNLRFAMHAITYRTNILKNSAYRIDEHCYYVDVEYSIYYLTDVKTIRLLSKTVYCYVIGSSEQSVNKTNMQKNIDQHTLVCNRLISFYQAVKAKPVTVDILIQKNIVNMIMLTEFRLILSLPDIHESKKRYIEFDKKLKRESVELYRRVILETRERRLKIGGLISFNRLTHYRLFVSIRKICWRQLCDF